MPQYAYAQSSRENATPFHSSNSVCRYLVIEKSTHQLENVQDKSTHAR